VVNSDNITAAPFKQEIEQATFAEKPQMKMNSLKIQKHGYLIHI